MKGIEKRKGKEELLQLAQDRATQKLTVSDYEIAFAMGHISKDVEDLSPQEIKDVHLFGSEYRNCQLCFFPSACRGGVGR